MLKASVNPIAENLMVSLAVSSSSVAARAFFTGSRSSSSSRATTHLVWNLQQQQQVLVLRHRPCATVWPDLLLDDTSVAGDEGDEAELDQEARDKDFPDEADEEQQPDDPVRGLTEAIAELRNNQVYRIVRMLKAWKNAGNDLTKDALLYVMLKLRKRNRFLHALEIADWIQETRLFPRNEKDLLLRLDLSARCGLIGKAEKLFRRLPVEHKTETAYNTMLLAYVSVRPPKLGRAITVYSKLKASGMITSPYAINLMAKLYRKRKLDEKVMLLMEDAKELGIALDLCFYNNLLAATYAVQGVQAAEELFRAMALEGRTPSFQTYITMASCYASTGLKPQAEGILEVVEQAMAGREILKQRRRYNALISLYAMIKDDAGMERCWEGLLNLRAPIVEDYCCMIKGMGKVGNVDRAEAIFREAEANDRSLKHSSIFNAIMFVYSTLGLVDKAEMLMQRMENELCVPLDHWCYHHLIFLYLKAGDIDTAEQLLRQAQAESRQTQDHRFKPLPWSLWLVLDSLAERAEIDRAENVFKRWKRSSLPVNALVYNRLLKVYLVAGRRPEKFVERMLDDGVRPNAETETLFDELNGKKPASQSVYPEQRSCSTGVPEAAAGLDEVESTPLSEAERSRTLKFVED